MALGAQWYLLFNVIGGAQSIPNDLREMATSIGLKGVAMEGADWSGRVRLLGDRRDYGIRWGLEREYRIGTGFLGKHALRADGLGHTLPMRRRRVTGRALF